MNIQTLNDSKINCNSPFNSSISCYQRPHINYKMNSKSKNKNIRKTIKEKSFNNNNNYNLINNKENINLNIFQKKTNYFCIYKKNDNINNNNYKKSLSKNIAFLCGIINSINNTKTNKKIKNNIKELIKEKKNNNNIVIINKYLSKIIKIQKWWKKIYENKMTKIKIIQKEWKKYIKNKILNNYYYFSFKKLIQSPNNNKTKSSTDNSNINLMKSFQEEKNKEKEIISNKLRKKFMSYITHILSKFFLLILNKLHLFNFIKILTQRINKGINQYVFYIIYNKHYSSDEKILFFEAIKRHIKVNLNMNGNNINEVAILLRTNVPKYFKDDFNKDYLPYINSIQEKNLVNTQLFLFNNEKLINYILYFFENEKGKELFNDKNKINYKKYIKNDLNLHKLKNRNIFGIMRYINYLKENFEKNNKSYSKLRLMAYKESYHSENVKEDNFNNDDELEESIEENNCDIGDNNINIKNFKLKLHYMNNNTNE